MTAAEIMEAIDRGERTFQSIRIIPNPDGTSFDNVQILPFITLYGVRIAAGVTFNRTFFMDRVLWNCVTFEGDAWFQAALFDGPCTFTDIACAGKGYFSRARFARPAAFLHWMSVDEIILTHATFADEAVFFALSIAPKTLDLHNTTFKGDCYVQSTIPLLTAKTHTTTDVTEEMVSSLLP